VIFMKNEIDIILDEEEIDEGREYWKIESGKHSFDLRLIKETENEDTRDSYLVSKYCNSLERALNVYVNERKRRLDVESLEELNESLDGLKEHLKDVKEIVEKSADIEIKI